MRAWHWTTQDVSLAVPVSTDHLGTLRCAIGRVVVPHLVYTLIHLICLVTVAVASMVGSFSSAANAQEGSLPYPQGTTLPWRTPGIDLAERGKVREALDTAFKALAAAWLKTPKPLPEIISDARPMTLSTRREGKKILAGDLTSPIGDTPLALEPTWCRIFDREVLLITITNTKTNELLAAAHTTVAKSNWNTQRDAEGLGTLLSTQMPALAREAMGSAQKKLSQSPRTDALHVGLSLEHHVTRVDEGSSHCLSALLEERLVRTANDSNSERGFTIARALGLDQLALVRNMLGQDPPTLTRPTRVLVLGWQRTRGQAQNKKIFPLSLELTSRPLESVFAHSIPAGRSKDTVTVSIDRNNRVAIDGITKLSNFLTSERNSLLLADAPQVARINRAWVYLDRGRAWGLKMNDRLVAGSGADEIKGHVVRFFGPEENLKSPRGFPIHEGAILYIRKNQKAPKVGTEFRMDPKVFPTPWPPPGAADKI